MTDRTFYLLLTLVVSMLIGGVVVYATFAPKPQLKGLTSISAR
jgi:hypothetical protein